MDNVIAEDNRRAIDPVKAGVMLLVSALLMVISFYLNLNYLLDLQRFSLSVQEKYVAAIASSIGLPLFLLIATQLWAEYRGAKNAVRSVFWGSVITLLGCVPIAFAALEKTL